MVRVFMVRLLENDVGFQVGEHFVGLEYLIAGTVPA
jgi:hypothetical protein